ncbi:MAG: nucleotidyltransferase family protein [Clostridiales bacterium]|jgi:predicted nucleotidyltransferase|nr:nucleotidyltransferase family protein [Clostridiales bacterium]
MNAAYIVSEFNPLHNGHLYHISRTRAALKPDAVVCVMSGAFTQRGSAAVADKWARAEMALRAGADLVVELHPAYACSSAEGFALGAIRTIKAFGVPGWLSFGAEDDDLAMLGAISGVLLAEPEEYRRDLAGRLGMGESFAKARAGALARYIRAYGAPTASPKPEQAPGSEQAPIRAQTSVAAQAQAKNRAQAPMVAEAQAPESEQAPVAAPMLAASPHGADKPTAGRHDFAGVDLEAVLKAPNNILALEYLKAIKVTGAPLRPFAVRRAVGFAVAGDSGVASAPCLRSAREIRELLRACVSDGRLGGAICAANEVAAGVAAGAETGAAVRLPPEIASLMPEFAARILERCVADRVAPVFDDGYFAQLLATIRRTPANRLAEYGDVGEGLENRIARAAKNCRDYESLVGAICTKRYPQSRIRRILARMLLGFDGAALGRLSLDDGPPYIRVLGFRPAGQALLAQAGRLRKQAALQAQSAEPGQALRARPPVGSESVPPADPYARQEPLAAAAVPIVTRFASLKSAADPRQRAFMELDAMATDIYATAYAGSARGLRLNAGLDYTRGAVRLP